MHHGDLLICPVVVGVGLALFGYTSKCFFGHNDAHFLHTLDVNYAT